MNYIQGLIIINVVAFAVFGIDKYQAKRGGWRISESMLFYIAVLGGSVGAFAGMHVFHHKTKKTAFRYGVPAIIFVQLLLILTLKVWG